MAYTNTSKATTLAALCILVTASGCDSGDKTAGLPPVAEFEVSHNEIFVWEKVIYSDISANDPENWNWTFEGGEPASSQNRNPEILYSVPGIYNVKLSVSNDHGEDEILVPGFIEVKEHQVWYGTLTDQRDGQTYKTIMLGGQLWMAENLNYMVEGAAAYDNDPENRDAFGLLYDFKTASQACPAGWRLPTRNEYAIIREYLGGEYIAGGKLKEYVTLHWDNPNSYASNSTGFSARGAGIYLHESHGFTDKGESTVFWTQTEATERLVWTMALINNNSRMAIQNTTEKTSLYSVRCIRD